MAEKPPTTPPKTENEKSPEKEPPKKEISEETEMLTQIWEELKVNAVESQVKAIEKLSIPQQIKILKAFVQKKEEKKEEKEDKEKSTPEKPKNPAQSPADVDEPKIETFAERNKIGGKWWNDNIANRQNMRMKWGEKP